MTGQAVDPISKRDLFYQELKRVLFNLYDPTVLNHSAIWDWIAPEAVTRSSFALQDIVIQSIEALKPNIKISAGGKARRTYQILRQRYIEQLSQEALAANLSISLRQLQRDEKIAREVLLDYLWEHYHLEEKSLPAALKPLQEQAGVKTPETQDANQSLRQELRQLTAAVAKTPVNLVHEILQVLDTLELFTRQRGVALKAELNEVIPPVQAPEPVLHQALTHLLMNMVQACAGNPAAIAAVQQGVEIILTVTGARAQPAVEDGLRSSFDLAAEMFQLCGAQLHGLDFDRADGQIVISVVFQAEKQLPILIVDDNPDALHLLERYLSGSIYQPVLIQSPQQALETAVRLKPRAIIIDVMMPNQDGWMLHSQLRKHPATGHIPVIISTILPQRELAFTLGVDDFLQKPVNQARLLEALDRLVNREG